MEQVNKATKVEKVENFKVDSGFRLLSNGGVAIDVNKKWQGYSGVNLIKLLGAYLSA